MKTKKIFATTLVASTIIVASMGSAFAMGGGQGGGQLSQYVTAEEKAELQSLPQEERQAYIDELKTKYNVDSTSQGQGKGQGQGQGKGQGQGNNSEGGHGNNNHNPGDMIANIPASDLSEKEIEILSYGYSEEMLARDTYNYLAGLYPEEAVFSKIASSEQKHMDSVEVLLDRYNIDTPSGYGDLESTYEALKTQGEISLKDALEVGLQIEVLDIEDIDDAIRNTDNDDFKVVFTNIGGASYNHLRSFLQAFESNGLNPDTETSEFLSADDLNTKGPLKYKLAERLEAEGVTLPEQVNSETLKAKGPNSDSHATGNMQAQSGKQNTSGKMGTANNAQQNYGVSTSLKNNYKATYQVKYGSLIAAMDDDKLGTLIEKIDALSLKVNSGEYSQSVQTKYNAMLLALREIAVENLDQTDGLSIESLLQ